MKYKFNLLVGVLVTAFATSNLCAVTYNISGSNLSNAVSDQAIVDNTGSVILSGLGTASLGYFTSILDPSSASFTVLADDFVSLATSNFGENPPANGLFVINTDIESDSTTFTDALGNDLYLFIGDAVSLSQSTSVGLINIGEQLIVPDGLTPPQTSINYSGGLFADGGAVVLGEITTNNVNITADGGLVSAGSFQLAAVPEPSSSALLGLGGLALILRRRR